VLQFQLAVEQAREQALSSKKRGNSANGGKGLGGAVSWQLFASERRKKYVLLLFRFSFFLSVPFILMLCSASCPLSCLSLFSQYNESYKARYTGSRGRLALGISRVIRSKFGSRTMKYNVSGGDGGIQNSGFAGTLLYTAPGKEERKKGVACSLFFSYSLETEE
jgi:hypothetical protein